MIKIPTIRSSYEKYNAASRPEKLLTVDQLTVGEVYQLFMLNENEGAGAESYLSQATIESINQAHMSVRFLRLALLNEKQQPIFAIDSAFSNGIWMPDRPVHAMDRTRELQIHAGLLLAIDQELDVDREFQRTQISIIDHPDVHS